VAIGQQGDKRKPYLLGLAKHQRVHLRLRITQGSAQGFG
jgi:hypothetical protein